MKLNIISFDVAISTNLLEQSFKEHYIIPMGFRYSAEILTGLQYSRKKFLNFVYIFDFNVWFEALGYLGGTAK